MFDIKKYINDSISTKKAIFDDDQLISKILNVVDIIIQCYRNDNKVLIAGNGGSAADAQHFAGELVSKFYFDRPGLAAFSLSTDTSVLTAIGNDYGYDHSFERQIQANGKKGDVFIGISTSGNSKNIVLASQKAKEKGLSVISMVGEKACLLDDIADIVIKVPSSVTPTVQESHLMIYHMICAMVEDKIFGEQK
ncbi:MAG: D-sedoheptulose 7-phosphate isomerase [Alphaproteobacteria bacterium]|nr:D-sedoheptulose 7-phosphate isomerase [Alphaproteobacteria bacterium]